MKLIRVSGIIAAIFIASCSAESSQQVEVPKPEKEVSSPLVATGFIGFFTEPHHRLPNQAEGKDPIFESIGYVGLDVPAALEDADNLVAAQKFVVVSSEALAAEITETDKLEAFRKTLDGMLKATRIYQRTAVTDCEICENLTLSPLSKFESYRDWDDQDRVILIIGLETRSPVNNGLRSGLGAFVFNPSGQYVDHIFLDYDFTNYLTKDFTEDVAMIYDDLLPIN